MIVDTKKALSNLKYIIEKNELEKYKNVIRLHLYELKNDNTKEVNDIRKQLLAIIYKKEDEEIRINPKPQVDSINFLKKMIDEKKEEIRTMSSDFLSTYPIENELKALEDILDSLM